MAMILHGDDYSNNDLVVFNLAIVFIRPVARAYNKCRSVGAMEGGAQPAVIK